MSPSAREPATVLFAVESMERAGAEQVVLSLVRHLDRNRFRPVVCCLTERGELAAEVEGSGAPLAALGKHPHFDLPVVPRLASVLKTHRVDVIHSHVWPANVWGRIVARAVRTPAILVTEHNVELWKKRAHLLVDRLLARATDRILCVSRAVAEFYETRAGIARDKLAVVPNGIDLAPFRLDIDRARRAGMKRELGLDPELPVASIVARLLPQKDHRSFLRAMKVLKERSVRASGLVVGEGRLRGELEAESAELGLGDVVRFAGERTDIPEVLAASDVVTLSSIHEGMPLAILEAMASSKPAVVTDVGGNREIVEDGETGFVVPPRDPGALAAALEKILVSPELARRFGAAGRARAEREFSVETMVQRNEAIYEEVLARKLARR